jgi:hypothetical protein
MQVKCKFCKKVDKNSKCTAKKSGGKHPKVKLNSNRECGKFSPDPDKLAEEANKSFNRAKIPVYQPTWRYYATNKELDEQNEKDGPKYVRINPDV